MKQSVVDELFSKDVVGGLGSTQKLNKFQLDCLQRICNNARKKLWGNCLSHGLYRASITAEDNIVYLLILASDEGGNNKKIDVACNLDTRELMSSKGVKFEKSKEVVDAIYEMIVALVSNIPFTVGMLQIPLEGRFEKGIIGDYTMESGTKAIFIYDSLDTDFFTD